MARAGFGSNRRSICGDVIVFPRKKYMTVRCHIRLVEVACPTWSPLTPESQDQLPDLSGFGLYAIGYNTRWNPKVRYYMTKLSSRGSKLLESFFTPEGKGQKAVEKKVQAKKWKSVFYKYVEMTASEMECLQLLQRVKWMPLRHCTSEDVLSRITEESGLLALGYSGHGTEVRLDVSALDGSEDWAEGTSEEQAMSPESDTERDAEIGGMNQVNYCYVEVVTINIREFLVKLLQRPGATIQDGHSCADIHHFIWHPSGTDQNKLYCKWYPVRPEILNQGCVRECLESALGHRLKYNAPGTCRER